MPIDKKINIIFAVVMILWAMFMFKDLIKDNNINTVDEEIVKPIEEDNLEIAVNPKDNFDKVINIALLGLDGDGYGKDKRSDVVIIASINTENNSLNLSSVSRDTLVYQPISKDYDKLNHAYPKKQSEGVVETLNDNLDLDIEHYVTFDYNALITAVDYIGGYPVNIIKEEKRDMAREGHYVELGEQMLSGEDALTYVRIRKHSGGDPGRNQRQRDLIIYIMEETQDMDKTQLLKFATKMLPLVKTSYNLLDVKDLLDLYISMRNGLQVNQFSYPFEYEGGLLSDKIWYAVPNTVEDNVKQFHEEVLGEPYYDIPKHIEEVSYEVSKKAGLN